MAHQDFSQICPIFKEGVEHELVINLQSSCTVTAGANFMWKPGREVVFQEAYALLNLSAAGRSTSMSCTIGIYKGESLSTIIGSIACGTVELNSLSTGYMLLSGSITSTALTSTDILSMAMISASSVNSNTNGCQVIIRYRDK